MKRPLGKASFFDIRNQAPNEYEVLISGYIFPDEESVNYTDLHEQFKEIGKPGNVINVKINSGGGSVYEGFAIYDLLATCEATVNTHCVGLAASMGAVLFQAGQTRTMNKRSRIMTHKVSGLSFGDAEDMKRTAEDIEQLEGEIKEIFMERSGQPEETVNSWFQSGKDKFFNSAEAKKYNLTDEVVATANDAAINNALRFQKVEPQFLVNTFSNFYKTSETMNEKFLKLIGLSKEATEEQITNKLNGLLSAGSEATNLKDRAATVDTLRNVFSLADDQPDTELVSRVNAQAEQVTTLTNQLSEATQKVAKANVRVTEVMQNAAKAHVEAEKKKAEAQEGEELILAKKYNKLQKGGKQGEQELLNIKKTDPAQYDEMITAYLNRKAELETA